MVEYCVCSIRISQSLYHIIQKLRGFCEPRMFSREFQSALEIFDANRGDYNSLTSDIFRSVWLIV